MNGIYDIFDHWYHGGTIYFYSDPHFSDEEMYRVRKNKKKELRNLTLDEYDTFQIKSINKKVGKNDTIVLLGDIGNIECVKRIRGYKVLIKGNHDAGCSIYKKDETNGLFDEVYGGRLLISEKIVLSHAPYDDPYAFNIHGHDHSGNSFKDDMHMNVCAENIDYTPVSIKSIINSGKLKYVPDLLRDAIDKQIEDKKRRDSHVRDTSGN